MMRVASTLVLVVMLLANTACHDKNGRETKTNAQAAINSFPSNQGLPPLDSSRFTVIPYDLERDKHRLSKVKGASLTAQEIVFTEYLLNVCVSKHNLEQRIKLQKMRETHPKITLKESDFIINLPNYKRQLVAFYNGKGEKKVWVNCFCKPLNGTEWRRKVVEVDDGGNCYFNTVVDLRRMKCLGLSINSVA
ncbi:hypothetical protein [Hymenobacter oligotrophus]|uniref:hypothetical protein n=1 Tax=Hymenobacter oligotrophus TaxID=2319843 RepID=UPI0013C32287|nr:hypothetical protein [Hymenobacter oligotrophus]